MPLFLDYFSIHWIKSVFHKGSFTRRHLANYVAMVGGLNKKESFNRADHIISSCLMLQLIKPKNEKDKTNGVYIIREYGSTIDGESNVSEC